jgi:AmmeMemoRadiSam system protein A
MPLPDSIPALEELSDKERGQLLDIAWDSIRHGLTHDSPSRPDVDRLPGSLARPAATFVTLHAGGDLRGCIGRLEAARPLAEDVAENAYAAAFRDPRFPPVEQWELAQLSLEISLLTPPEPMVFAGEEDLLAQIRPGIDGLILEDQGHRGTFLPSVWESLPEPHDFLAALRRKAGLPADHWSDTLRVCRYRTLCFGG